MKKNLSAYITAITLISSLAASIQLAAQELQPQKKELPRYTIIDLGPAADWVGGVNNKGSSGSGRKRRCLCNHGPEADK